MTKASKLIRTVKLHQEHDIDGDTSYYGVYSNHKTSEYSIDREHRLDCQVNSSLPTEALDLLERIGNYLTSLSYYNNNEDTYEAISNAQDIIAEKQEELQACDCDGRGDRLRYEYQYFNPSENYVDKFGRASDGNTPEDVRKYVRQDYKRMEDGIKGYWSFIYVYAEATVLLNGVELELRSGGIGGIESDSKESIEDAKVDTLHDLSEQLSKLGFGNRAIALVFKNLEVV